MKICALLLVFTMLWVTSRQPCCADVFNQSQMFGIPSQRPLRQNTQVPRVLTLEDLLQPVNYPVKYLQAVPLRDLSIPGLDKNSLDLLGFNYFVAVDNTPYADMSSLYRSNRLRGKSNFVTVDSIIHPYFAFSNRVLATAIEHHMSPEFSSLLKAMLAATLNDYDAVKDNGIRQDLEYNLAYLGVALKLLDSKFVLPDKGNSVQLANDELKSISEGTIAASKIFGYDEDFSNYIPQGWYKTSPALQNFYRARQWVSHMGYPLTETSQDNAVPINNFRRSILLYRSLEEATVNGAPAYLAWKKLYQAWKILGCFEGYPGNKVLLPDQYQSIFRGLSPDLKVTMDALVEPLYRAKLILAVKRQISSGLKPASITEMQSRENEKETSAAFALFPPAGDAEWPWIKAIARAYVDQDEGTELVPVSLSCLQARGAGEAGNIMLSRIGRLNQAMVGLLPELYRLVKSDNGAQPDRPWPILDTYFRFPSDGSQNAIRTEIWMSRRAESAFAAWVDSHLAIAPAPESTTVVAGSVPPAAGAATSAAPQNDSARNSTAAPKRTGPRLFTSYTEEALALTKNNTRKQAYFHYLEPSPESYRAICEDALGLSYRLQQLGYLAPTDSGRFTEFIRLCRRLERIAVCELKDQVLPVGDLKLLGNIDKTMGPVDVPLSNILYVSGKKTIQGSVTGVNLALGHPAQLYIILQLGDKVWLARGALYSYYEIGGGHISALHWQRKQDFSLLRVPFWTDKFDAIVQAKEAQPTAGDSKTGSTK